MFPPVLAAPPGEVRAEGVPLSWAPVFIRIHPRDQEFGDGAGIVANRISTASPNPRTPRRPANACGIR